MWATCYGLSLQKCYKGRYNKIEANVPLVHSNYVLIMLKHRMLRRTKIWSIRHKCYKCTHEYKDFIIYFNDLFWRRSFANGCVCAVVYVQLPWGPWIFRRQTGPILCIIAQKFRCDWLFTLWTGEFLTGTCAYKMLNFNINMHQTTAFWKCATNFFWQRWRLQY